MKSPIKHLSVIFTILIAMPLGAQQFNQDSDFHTLEQGPAYNVIPWANPSASGPLRTLAIAPYSTMGDIALLAEHIELDLETVALWEREHLGFDPRFPQPEYPEASREAVIKELQKALKRKKLDVIILAQSDPAILPTEIQESIIEHVEKGAGLLIATHGLAKDSPLSTWLGQLNQPELLPDLYHGTGPLGIDSILQSELLTCRAAGEGRVVQLSLLHAPSVNHSLVPIPPNPFKMREEYLDNAYALIARVLRWVSRQDDKIRIVQALDVAPQGPDDEEIPPGYPPEFIEAMRKNVLTQPLRPYAIQLDAPAPETMDVWYRLRHEGVSDHDVLRSADNAPLRKGDAYYPLDVIAAPGSYLLDIWLKNRKGTVTWHTERITVPGWPTLSNIRLSRNEETATWIQPNDLIVVTADVDSGPLTTRRQVGTAFARVVDSYGRQIGNDSAVVGSEGGEVVLRLEIADAIAPLVMVEVFSVPSVLESEDSFVEQAAREVFYLPVRQAALGLEPTLVITTATPPDHGMYRQLEILRDNFGARVLHAPLSIDNLLAAGRLGYHRLSQITSSFIPPTAANQVRVPCLSNAQHLTALESEVESAILQSYAGGAPFYSLGANIALTHTDAEVCQSTDCLNAFRTRLRSKYGTLEALNEAWPGTFLSWDDILPPPLNECREAGNYRPWLDFRSSMDTVFATCIEKGIGFTHAVDPQARIGFQASAMPPSPESGIQWNRLRSLADFVAVPNEPKAIRRLQSFGRTHPWDGIVLESSHFRVPEAQARWLAWNAAFHQIPGIWLNEPFADAASRLLGPTGKATTAFEAFGAAQEQIRSGLGDLLLRALPYQNDIAILDTPENDLLDKALNIEGSDVYTEDWFAATLNQLGFAPFVLSLNPEQHARAQSVNTVILADTRLLTDQEHAYLNAFHDDGGLIIASRRPGASNDGITPGNKNKLPFLHPLRQSETHPSLWSNRPVWTRQLDLGESDRHHMGKLLEMAGNVPMPELRIDDDQRSHLGRFYYAFGEATILGSIPNREVRENLKRASYEIDDKHYAYDLLASDTLPSKKRFQWNPAPGEPAILSVLPYRVSALNLTVNAAAVSGTRLPVDVTLDVKDATPGLHLLSLRVLGPEDVELGHYRQIMEAPDGIAHTYIPLAQNEGPVRLTVIATDLLTGISARQYVTVQ